MKTTNLKYLFSATCMLLAQGAFAQNNVQCFDDGKGSMVASLPWQNTLGIEAANSICRQHAANLEKKRADEQARAEASTQPTAKPTVPADFVPMDGSRRDDSEFLKMF